MGVCARILRSWSHYGNCWSRYGVSNNRGCFHAPNRVTQDIICTMILSSWGCWRRRLS